MEVSLLEYVRRVKQMDDGVEARHQAPLPRRARPFDDRSKLLPRLSAEVVTVKAMHRASVQAAKAREAERARQRGARLSDEAAPTPQAASKRSKVTPPIATAQPHSTAAPLRSSSSAPSPSTLLCPADSTASLLSRPLQTWPWATDVPSESLPRATIDPQFRNSLSASQAGREHAAAQDATPLSASKAAGSLAEGPHGAKHAQQRGRCFRSCAIDQAAWTRATGLVPYAELFATHMADSLRPTPMPQPVASLRQDSCEGRCATAPSVASSFGQEDDAMLASRLLPWLSPDTSVARAAPFLFSCEALPAFREITTDDLLPAAAPGLPPRPPRPEKRKSQPSIQERVDQYSRAPWEPDPRGGRPRRDGCQASAGELRAQLYTTAALLQWPYPATSGHIVGAQHQARAVIDDAREADHADSLPRVGEANGANPAPCSSMRPVRPATHSVCTHPGHSVKSQMPPPPPRDCSTAPDVPERHRVHPRRGAAEEDQLRAALPQYADLEAELLGRAATGEDAGPYFREGELARLQRRWQHSHNPSVLDLSCSMWGKLQMAAVQDFLGRNTKIVEISISNNDIDDAAFAKLCEHLHSSASSLRRLRCCNNSVSARGLQHVLPHVAHADGATRASASLRGGVSMKLSAAPSPALPVLLLTHLHLSVNPLGDAGVKALTQVICNGGNKCQLEVLELERCGLTERCAPHLSELLSTSTTLRDLSVGWNNFGARGGRYLAIGLEANIALRRFSIAWAGIGDEGSSHIAQALTCNSSLAYLDCSGNNVGYGSCLVFAEAMDLCHGLSELVLADNLLTQAGVRVLLKAIMRHAERDLRVSLQGVSFARGTEKALPRLDEFNPDGRYTIRLGEPSERLIALEIFRLAEKHGRKSLRNGMLDGKSCDLVANYDKYVERMPVAGTLDFEFRSQRRPPENRPALSRRCFHAMWTRLVRAQIGVRCVTDKWAFDLLDTLCLDNYFSSQQAQKIIKTFTDAEDKVAAAERVFSRVVDPEEWYSAVSVLTARQQEAVHQRLGLLEVFNAKNPTGSYTLIMINQLHAAVAVRLLELWRQQLSKKYCKPPLHVCFQSCTHNGVAVDVSDPRTFVIPKDGTLELIFVDLTPIPAYARELSYAAFAVLLAKLTNQEVLDVVELKTALEDPALAQKVDVLNRFQAFDGISMEAYRSCSAKNGPAYVKDLKNFLRAIHAISINAYFNMIQIKMLLELVPPNAPPSIKVELVCICFSRFIGRKRFLGEVILTLDSESQVAVCQRLGYANVFNAQRPGMYYRLRMPRADEYHVAYQLYRLALITQDIRAFRAFKIDGEEKSVVVGTGLWAVMKGGAAEGTMPTVTIDVDFVWSDLSKEAWAAVVIQSAWRAWRTKMERAVLKSHPTGGKSLEQQAKDWARRAKSRSLEMVNSPTANKLEGYGSLLSAPSSALRLKSLMSSALVDVQTSQLASRDGDDYEDGPEEVYTTPR